MMNIMKNQKKDEDQSADREKLLIKAGGRLMEDLQKSGCPVCNHMEEVIFDFLTTWQCALTNDKNVQKEYAAELGFCPAHTWQLATVSSVRGISRGCSKLLEHLAEELTKLIDSSENATKKIAEFIKDPESCRACRLLRDTEETYTRHLAAFLEQEEGRIAYADSHGVCLRHLSSLVSFLTFREVIDGLLFETARHLKDTAENMRRYVLKHEARERHLLNRDERYAYLRALVNLAGARNVCAPHIGRI
jgi:hypothetical protein